MRFFPYEITVNISEATETFRLRLKPASDCPYSFLPGQYAYLTIPGNDTAKPFSIASAPNDDTLEFCIKTYGTFTTTLSQLKTESPLLVSEPRGSFVWDEKITDATFLIGGIGISPVMSMLSHIEQTKQHPNLTLFYGNRTPEHKAYAKDLAKLQRLLPLRVIDIYSHLEDRHPWQGYRGFIIPEIVKKNLNIDEKNTYFLTGPPVFLEKMQGILTNLHVQKKNIKTEKIS